MNSLFKKITLIGRHSSAEVMESLLKLAAFLKKGGLAVAIDAETAANHNTSEYKLLEREQIGDWADLVIVLGGDGTMLSIARLVAAHEIPLIGINQGRLGFMTDISLGEMLEAVQAILQGSFIPEDRGLLQSIILRGKNQLQTALALNDVVFSRGATGHMIEFEIFIDNQFVYSQRSDGLIVSTPTGSTAYALSSGGPILHPTLPAMALVPICPQSMSNRPIVVNDSSVIEFMLTRALGTRVHFDGQTHFDLLEGDRVVIQRYQNSLRILHPLNYNYYDMLRHKLHWGEKLL